MEHKISKLSTRRRKTLASRSDALISRRLLDREQPSPAEVYPYRFVNQMDAFAYEHDLVLRGASA